ncbi:heterogeneous nuclear ribonucleoprotein U-like protein 2 [Austrofundulus limnaeus]|uniref:Heterogeneous nuclear ribonucleoprotein U-like protein 2 n=1 Tax=Austrofundulus limnaeus TaxID=52670 RepID=A0A2I4B043_AUSLI|nr:PREDICTED: heterogeneous nuclear ribonucleoprotein U-like protein 2 [Austrofundulus limnaeus]
MKLTDIKKLKVKELRSTLTALGLDPRGLKAELVDRLWSASQARQGSGILEETKQANESALTPSVPEQTVEPQSVSHGVTARCEVDPVRQYTNTSTQTEPEPSAVQPGSQCFSTPELVCQTDEGGLGPTESITSENISRGRAFYEFKEEIRYKRAKSPQPPSEKEDAEVRDVDKVRLDTYGCHLHFEVGPDGSCGQPRFWDRFPSLWSGCRLSHGVQQGRVGFEVRLDRKLLSVEAEDQEVREPYGLRAGWSVVDTSLLLGEDELSFAYDGRGKKVCGGKEEEYGEPFSEGDIIGCYASFSNDGAAELFFQKNGRVMGVAFYLDAPVLLGHPLFPHVLCKSCSVQLLLDPAAPQWYPGPLGFTPLAALPAGQRVCSSSAPASRAQSEVVMMVGLPGSGKSHWVRTHVQKHPEKKYKLLGTEELLACMISGGHRENRLQQASQCLTELIKMAAETPGNYILDQCNVLFSARRHKLQLFAGFRRRAVVVFPAADEWRRRLLEHRTKNGEHVPETALLKLQVSCSLPEEQADLLEELQFVELPQGQAQALLKEYQDEARRLLPPVPRRERKKPRFYKKRHPLHLPPPSHRTQWTGPYGQCWNDGGADEQTWSQQPGYWNNKNSAYSY